MSKKPPIAPEKREQFLSDAVEQLLDGVTDATHYVNGAAKLRLNPEAGKAFIRLKVLVEMEREG
jgi:hypothetical protein